MPRTIDKEANEKKTLRVASAETRWEKIDFFETQRGQQSIKADSARTILKAFPK